MSKFKIYDVTYAVTRAETYRVRAKSAKDAEGCAFEEGSLLDTGDTTACDCLEIEEISGCSN